MSAADVIQLRYDDKHSIVASGNTVTIDGKETFDLTAVNEVAFYTYRRILNGYYAGTYFELQFKQDKRTRSIRFNSGSDGDKHLDEQRDGWERIANRVWAIAIPRIATEIEAKVRAGESVKFGPPATRVTLSPEGVQSGAYFPGKPVAWSQVTRTVMDNGQIYVLGRKAPDAEEKPIGGVTVGWWNSYALPNVVLGLMARPPS